MIGRNKRGRFTAGNPFALQGWRGLISKRFDGDVTAARLVGPDRAPCLRQASHWGTVFEYRLQTIWRHPAAQSSL